MNRVATVVIAVLLVIACSTPADMPGFAGTYVMTMGIDTLRLDTVGRYRRTHLLNTAPPTLSIDTGKWTLANKGRLVTLHGFVKRWPEHGYDPVQGWHAPDTITRQAVALTTGTTWTGRIALGVRPELGWRYLHVK